MEQVFIRKLLLNSTAICAVGLTSLMGGAAWAQETATSTAPVEALADQPIAQNAEGEATNEVEELVVTGSRIPQPGLTSVSPVTVVGSQEVKLQGVTRTEDLVNQLPQVFSSQGSTISNGATGTATVDLRGIGANRTLVLVDGRRLMPGAPGAGSQSSSAADLNFIPSALIDRVEVVTGGASAVYGADAVAGVVNFIMQKNFEGVRLDAQHSFYQHKNDDERSQAILNARAAGAFDPSRFAVPEDNVRDGFATDLTLVVGVNAPDNRGNITAYAGYRNIDPVVQANRDYSACALNAADANPNRFVCGGSGTTAPARIITAGGTGSDLTLDPAAPGGRGFRAYNGNRDAFNFAAASYFQRPDERYTLGAFANYELRPEAEVYTQLMFMDDRSVSQVGASGLFQDPINFNCTGNPLFSAAQFAALCGPTVDQDPATAGLQTDADPTTPGQQGRAVIGRRNVEGGPRQEDLRHTSYRGVVGLRGDLGENWRYDAYGQYGTVLFQSLFLNDVSRSRARRALDVVADANGNPVCRSATGAGAIDPQCVPYDIFSIAGPSAAAVAYLSTPGLQQGNTKETVVSGTLSGDLSDYGFQSPFATNGVGVALGAEYRRESLELNPDLSYQTDDLTGQGGATLPVAGSYDLYELFGEARVPLAQDRPFFRELSLELGYRYSEYSLGFDTQTYKVGGEWRPVEDIRFRASLNRAVRAPNIVELFTAQSVGLNGTTDPCAGTAPQFTAAQCANTGVSAAQYGRVVENTASQYNGLTGGNPDLLPETSDTTSFGLAFTPSFIDGFSVTVDYYKITVEDRIGQIGQDVTLSRCAITGDPFYCNLIRRAPGTASLFLGTGGFVIDTNLNTGSLEVSGVDIEANYRLDFSDVGGFLAPFGGLSFNYVGSWLQDFIVETLPGDPTFDCAGYYGAVCTGSATPAGAPLNEYKHKARMTWRTPWNVDASISWRHLSSVDVDSSSTEIVANGGGGGGVFIADKTLDAMDYIDLAALWRARTGLNFRVGVNNVFDEDPPLIGQQNCPATVCNGNTFPQVYDALGRYVFVGLTADF